MRKPTACGYCNATGHTRKTCGALKADAYRAATVDAGNQARVASLPPTKNPFHWERMQVARSIVSAELHSALRTLSDNAPASAHIKRAITLLEGCR